ncbi:hypothetical protein KJ707_01780 [Patescibacteria group bacterium]|nr:hypothetical protein [Patescibacteria group bacterium]MBU2543282.1 hypothetical protein [Patescibacteria group bacterium]
MSIERKFSIIRQEYGYAGIQASGVTTDGELIMSNSPQDLKVTKGLTRVIKNPPVLALSRNGPF